MAKPHKFAWNGLDFETSLPMEHVANMAQRAAQESTGDLLKGKHRIVSVGSSDREIDFRINDFLISFNKLMLFSVTFQPTGERLFGTSTIGWYMTSQQTVGGFVPVSTKSMVAHHTYMQFVRNLGGQIRQADPTSRVTFREGVEPVGGAAAPAVTGASAPPPPPLPPASFGVRPSPTPVPAQFASVPPPPPPAQFASVPPPPPPPPARPHAAVPPPPPPPPVAIPAVPPVPAIPAGPAAPMPPQSGLVTGIPGSRPAQQAPPPPPVRVNAPPVVAQLFAEDDDLDSTRISQASATARPWSLVFSDGQSMSVDSAIVIGRDPVIPPTLAGGRAVPVSDPWKSVSKTHAILQVRDGMLWVTDLHSTNGTSITNAVGEAMPCPPEVAMPVGDGWTISASEVSIVAKLGA